MTTAAFPTIIAAVFTTAEAASPGARVVRGLDISEEAGDVVMVGIASLDDSPGWESPGSFDQEFLTFGGARLETGTVSGVAYSRNGDADQGAATAAAFALIDGLGTAIRTDPTLGISAINVVAEFQTGDVKEQQNNEGAVTEVSFAVQYQARF